MNVTAWNKEVLVHQYSVRVGVQRKHSAKRCGPQEKNSREVGRRNSYERAESPRRFGKVAHSQCGSDCKGQSRFLKTCCGCGRCVNVWGHSGCPNRRPAAGRYCLSCPWQALPHRRPVRKPRTFRWPNCPDRGPGSVRCKKGSPDEPPSPSPFCRWDICVSSPLFLLCELCVKVFCLVDAKIAEAKVTLFSREEYISAENAEGRTGGDAMKLFSRRNGRHRCDAGIRPLRMSRQDFHDAPNQIVSICLGDFYAGDVPSLRDFSVRQFNVREVQLPVDLRSHAFQASFPDERIILRRAFDQRRESTFGVRQTCCRFSVCPGRACLWVQIFCAQIL